MALINRVSRLFKADFNAVLDRIEEPEQVLRQAIREMEDELAGAEHRLESTAHEQAELNDRRSELEAKVAEINEELDLCFAKKKDTLARTLVRRKLEADRLAKRLNAKIASNEKAVTQAKLRIEENRAALESLKQKAELFTERTAPRTGSEFDDVGWMARELTVSEDEIEVAFLREQQARSGS